MKILYAYRYGIVGGVSTQLLLRQQALHTAGYGCDLFFSQDNGLHAVLGAAQGVYFGSNSMRYGTLLKQGAYDHVVVIDTPELLAASHANWWQRPRKVWLDVHTTTTTGLSYLATVSAKKLSGVMVPTQYSAGLVQRRLDGAQPRVIPNVINGAVFSQALVDIAETSVRQFIWVGKLDSHKNWRLALVYARLLKDLLGPVQLTIVGGYTAPAEVGDAFFETAARLEVLQHVRWIDRIDNASLAALYRQCAHSGGAMLITSRDESFGMAAAEALMCGCSLITNDLPVFREVFPVSDMIKRVDIWQPDQIERAANELASGVDAEVSQRMYEYLSSNYGASAFMTALETALET